LGYWALLQGGMAQAFLFGFLPLGASTLSF
jgi:hypothetical protein